MPIDTILRRLYALAVVTGWIFLAVILFYLARPRADWETITHEQYGFSFEYPTGGGPENMARIFPIMVTKS
ncbi:MAG: hypothetical protein IPL78_18935 [Chloroflexi bacterium]|nr:hypothetical protein [Chloroflexota bacterium]